MTEQQYDTFSKFGKSFQEKLVKTILFDRNFANQMEEVLDTNYLELKYLQVFVDLMFQHKQEALDIKQYKLKVMRVGN